MVNPLIRSIIILVVILVLFLDFLRSDLTGTIPQDMIDESLRLKSISKDKLELAKNTYDFVDKKYTSQSQEYLRQPDKVFLKDVEIIWDIEDNYIPSNTQNAIFKEMLILTEEFEEEDFTFVQARCYILPRFTPHEYWELNIDNEEVFIDLWMADNTLLENSFGCFSNPPCGDDDFVCSEGFP
tara:strand:+ start:7749 stop:8297 length:549 start_codon:yes stop_codon:yes gene_type:complete